MTQMSVIELELGQLAIPSGKLALGDFKANATDPHFFRITPGTYRVTAEVQRNIPGFPAWFTRPQRLTLHLIELPKYAFYYRESLMEIDEDGEELGCYCCGGWEIYGNDSVMYMADAEALQQHLGAQHYKPYLQELMQALYNADHLGHRRVAFHEFPADPHQAESQPLQVAALHLFRDLEFWRFNANNASGVRGIFTMDHQLRSICIDTLPNLYQ